MTTNPIELIAESITEFTQVVPRVEHTEDGTTLRFISWGPVVVINLSPQSVETLVSMLTRPSSVVH